MTDVILQILVCYAHNAQPNHIIVELVELSH